MCTQPVLLGDLVEVRCVDQSATVVMHMLTCCHCHALPQLVATHVDVRRVVHSSRCFFEKTAKLPL